MPIACCNAGVSDSPALRCCRCMCWGAEAGNFLRLHAICQTAQTMSEAKLTDRAHQAEAHLVSAGAAGASAGALRHAFFDAFTLFAIAAQTMSEAILTGSSDASEGPSRAASHPHRRLLVLLSNCQHVRTVLLPQLSRRCALASPGS